MSDNSKPTQNDALSFEQWLGKAERLDAGATPGPWVWSEPDPEWTGDYYGVWERDEDMPPVAATHAPGEYGKADAEWIAHARTALPQAVDVLRAVTDLHRPRNTVTRSASGHLVDTPGPCTDCDRDWPCPTVTAINEALGEE